MNVSFPSPKKPTILMVCHLPPPVHGASMVGQSIVRSKALNAAFDLRVVAISGADLEGLGRFTVRKLFKTVGLVLRAAGALARSRPAFIYLTPSIDGFGFLRDTAIAAAARLFRVPRVLHIHMRGLNERYRQGGWRRALYRTMFEGATVIHLDPSLYDDVSALVPHANFCTVSNGLADPRAGRDAAYLSPLVPDTPPSS